jgi:hypothetical protein
LHRAVRTRYEVFVRMMPANKFLLQAVVADDTTAESELGCTRWMVVGWYLIRIWSLGRIREVAFANISCSWQSSFPSCLHLHRQYYGG